MRTVDLGLSLSSVSIRSRIVVKMLWKKSEGSVESVRKDGRSATIYRARTGRSMMKDGSCQCLVTAPAWLWK